MQELERSKKKRKDTIVRSSSAARRRLAFDTFVNGPYQWYGDRVFACFIIFQIGLLVYSDETEYRIRLALVKAKENMKDPNNLDELKSFIATTTARYICPKTLLKMMHTMEQMEAMEQRDQVHSALKRFYLDIGQADLGSDRDRSLRGKVMVASSTQQLLNAIIASGTSHLVSSRERYTQAWLARTKRIQEMEEKEKEIGRYRFID